MANSPTLLSLASLSPPSPVLSPCHISSPWSSGEIPILLGRPTVDSVFQTSPVTPSRSSLCTDFKFVIDGSQSSTSVDPLSPIYTSEGGARKSALRSSELDFSFSTTIDETFGAIQHIEPDRQVNPSHFKHLEASNMETWTNFTSSGSLLQVPSCIPASASQTIIRQNNLDPACQILRPAEDKTPSSSCPDKSLSQTACIRLPQTFPALLSPGLHSLFQDDDTCQVRCLPPPQTCSKIPEPTYAPAICSPTIATLEAPPCWLRDSSLLKDILPGNERPLWLSHVDDSPQDSAQNMSDSSPPFHQYVSNAIESDGSTFVGVPPVLSSSRNMTMPSLPSSLAWLKCITVNLLIDQEGFRSVNASFKLAGYTNVARGGLETNMVDFMPVQREIYLFHYAPLDSPPILRRISVNNNEARDYISREASLNLKTNGVYTVRGSETCTMNSTDTDSGKLKWKLDYVVQDRRVEGTGKIMSGEKTITPLTFSCSPFLLHPLQGKKVRLIHMVKKHIVPRLVAEKMELPRQPNSGKADGTIVVAASPSHALAKPYMWGLHRRARSHVPKHPILVTACPPGQLWQGVEDRPIVHLERPRRRRASSAGERTRIPMAGYHELPYAQIIQNADTRYGEP
jgi:hypothetical protein